MPPRRAWLREMSLLRYDICTMEDSPRMPRHIFRDALSGHAHILCVEVGPEDMGWPARRKRLFQTALDRSSL
eukprot:4344019-Alexandrium_andersonii.AAC.1